MYHNLKEYFVLQVFQEHNIDGSSLPLLTEDHLTLRLGMKLGPALKLKSILAKKLGPLVQMETCAQCSHCSNSGKKNAKVESDTKVKTEDNAQEVPEDKKIQRKSSGGSGW